MLWLNLLINGLVWGCALGMVAVSFSLIFATTRFFHVAHAAVYSLCGYVTWSMVKHGLPEWAALAFGIVVCGIVGGLIQKLLYERLDRRGATHLVILIASLGLAAVMQNALAATYTSNVLQFGLPWGNRTMSIGGVLLSNTQLLTVAFGIASYFGALWFAHRTALGKRMRAVASNPFLAEITRLQPRQVHIAVMAIGSALVCIPGVLVPLDLGLQPVGGVPILLTATIAVISGGVGSISGAFLLAVVIAVLQNLSLLFMPGEWSIGITFGIFVIFMLFRPRGLFAG